MADYKIFEVSEEGFEYFEQMGSKSKFWYIDRTDGQSYLFKSIHTSDKYNNDIIRFGEDWAEKIAYEIASQLDVPTAEYDLATYNGERGIRTKNFLNEDEEMVFGNQLLEHIATISGSQLERGQKSQTITRVSVILERVIADPPASWTCTAQIKDALDVFLGYMLLDVLIGNQDRHSENWGLVQNKHGQIRLAESFDHAASLGRNELDEVRLRKLRSKSSQDRIPNYVSRAKTHFYMGDKRLKTLEAFVVFGSVRPRAALEWVEKLELLTPDKVWEIVSRVPSIRMSDVSKLFAAGVVIANRTRILTYKQFFYDFLGDS
jgi:hypothetical protein